VVLVLILAVNFGVLLFVRNRMKREMDTQVQQQVQLTVNSYFALSSGER
jgi:hypothetical protein